MENWMDCDYLVNFAAMTSGGKASEFLLTIYDGHPGTKELLEDIQKESQGKFHLKGLSGSSSALVASSVVRHLNGIFFFLFPENEEAAYFYNDLAQTGIQNIYFFPSSFRALKYSQEKDPANTILRTEVIRAVSSFQGAGSLCIVSYAEAIAEPIVSKDTLLSNTFRIERGNKLSISFLDEVLHSFHFERVEFVYEPGQYAIRGSLVDIFSYASDNPFRIDFFGEEVDSIRTFDVETQLSVEQKESVELIPDLAVLQGNVSSILRQPGIRAIIWAGDLPLIAEHFRTLSGKPVSSEGSGNFITYSDAETLLNEIKNLEVIETGLQAFFPGKTITYSTQPQPVFRKNFDLLVSHLEENELNGITTVLLAENPAQEGRLAEIIRNLKPGLHLTFEIGSLHEGFTDNDLRISLFTDHQIFDRYHKYHIKGLFHKSEQITLQELMALQPGDYVVHIDHGIGKFAGLQKIEVNGRMQEALRLVYKDNDILFVNIHSLHKISKYKGKEGTEPALHKLGSGVWNRTKQNTKKKVKDIARDLIALYAKRLAAPGFAFSPDSYLQKELEASFIYEDTPDQLKATEVVKAGMEAPHPMDMLVCGDVGFGKTEIAIRAAFKAVADNKQVAVLVPTTILALQHYKTFTERLKDFPCSIDYITRFRKPADQKNILKRLAEGKLDIVIGTHKLVGKEVKFRDLGLLIIDEEQKFGVAVKEKLKQLRLNVDTITLTATPIPRTLQFSLMGARDLAIINTPPPNRHPIHTELHIFDEDVIREAILYEVSRYGQVFFIHNRVQNIFEIQNLINRICPQVKTVVAHGQMDGSQLERIMTDFVSGDYDVLISTSIIESGLDIPNANTIIINNAHQFGLADLHQLRGRVGRSNRKAYCYLLAPPLSLLTGEARRRLKAIAENTDLGSGFNIAMQDLDIRGAGNLLGAEQSGFITEIGFETYQKILAEAMQELREEEFSELFPEKSAPGPSDRKKIYVTDCQIDTDLELHFPEHFIPNATERIRLYRELDTIPDEISLENFRKILIDRFGPLPEPTKGLLDIVRLRWAAQELGFEKLVLRDGKLLVYFVSNPLSPYYSSETFRNVLQFVQKHPERIRMKEAKEKLSMVINQVVSTSDAIGILEQMSPAAF
ncbi:MAG TPA: transcription-repair coupling factor [Bacteroidales bacterium]|nr:transcription-repair coupling factor [Bacteroidales bacterium]